MRLSALPQASHAADRIWLSDLQPWIIRIIGGLNGMAAKFEVYIASKKYPSIKMCETIFPIVGKIQFSEKCIVWNGWLPTKEDVLYTQDDEQIERCVLNGKVVSFDGKAGSYIIGARQYFENGVFSTELWFDTSYFPELDANISNEFCNSFCQLTKQNILGLCIVAEIKFFAMGTEMCVDYSERLDESIKKSHNVMCYWSKKASRD